MSNVSGMNRQRIWIAVSALLVLIVGLASRSSHIPFPTFLATYAGDTLWAALVFLLLAFLKPRKQILLLAAVALGIAFFVELLQLYQTPWLNSIRDTLPGRLILGRSGGFRFSDLICYTVGVGASALLYQWFAERTLKSWTVIIGVSFTIFIATAVIACNTGEGKQLFSMIGHVPGRDKTGHFILMGLLAFFIVLMLVPRMKSSAPKATIIVASILSLVIALEEGSQHFISSRTFSLADLLCSLAGVIVFTAIAFLIIRKSERRHYH